MALTRVTKKTDMPTHVYGLVHIAGELRQGTKIDPALCLRQWILITDQVFLTYPYPAIPGPGSQLDKRICQLWL